MGKPHKFSDDELQLIAEVEAWMESKHRRTTYYQSCLPCRGTCRSVPNCLIDGCCVGMEEHFPKGSSKAEAEKRWKQRSMWRKLKSLPPKLEITEPPESYQKYVATLPSFEEEVVEAYIKHGPDSLSVEAQEFFSNLPEDRRKTLALHHRTYQQIYGEIHAIARKSQRHFDSEYKRYQAAHPDSRGKLKPFSYLHNLTDKEIHVLLTTPDEHVPRMLGGFHGYKRNYLAQAQAKLPEAMTSYIQDPHTRHTWTKTPSDLGYLYEWNGVWLHKSEIRALSLLPDEEKQTLFQKRAAFVVRERAARQLLASIIAWYAENKTKILLKEFQRASYVGGLQIFAPSGWGKSVLLGALCAENAKRGIATVLLDASGAATTNALDLLAQIPGERGQAIEEKIRYCNMAGEVVGGNRFVTSWPILHQRFENEDLYTTSKRFIELIGKTEKAFSEAPIMGMARMRPLLTSISMVLSVLGLPLVSAYNILSKPTKWDGVTHHSWKEALERAEEHPEAREAVKFLREEFFTLEPYEQERRSEPLRNRLYLLRFNPTARKMFANEEATISWEVVAREGQQVYIDLSRELDDDARQFQFWWVWQSLLEYVKHRGHAGHEHPPLCIVIDELTFFVRGTQLNTDVIIEELRMFTQVYRRNARIAFIGATQEQAELPDSMLRATLQLGNLLFGATTEVTTASGRAERFDDMDPWEVKYRELIWENHGRGFGTYREHFTFLSLEEQRYLNSRKYLSLRQGEGLYARTLREGQFPRGPLTRVAVTHLLQQDPPSQDFVSWYKKLLMQRDGILVNGRKELKTASALPPAPQEHLIEPAEGSPSDKTFGKAEDILTERRYSKMPQKKRKQPQPPPKQEPQRRSPKRQKPD